MALSETKAAERRGLAKIPVSSGWLLQFSALLLLWGSNGAFKALWDFFMVGIITPFSLRIKFLLFFFFDFGCQLTLGFQGYLPNLGVLFVKREPP
jgi:hypothetical protein